MGKREAFALVAIPLLVAAVVWPPTWVFLILLGAVLLLAADELLAMAREANIAAGRWIPLFVLAGLLFASWRWGAAGMGVAVTAAVIVLTGAQLAHPRSPEGSLTGAATSALAVLYVGLSGVCLGWLRILPEGNLGIKVLFFFLACIWLGDSGAYYLGSRFGRHKMSPRISPNKTWEGLVGGGVATFAGAAAAKLVLGLPFAWTHMATLAAILAIAAPLGDLVESQFKRDTEVKDSSSLIPGHGGAFDRTDSLLFAAPPVLAYLVATGLMG